MESYTCRHISIVGRAVAKKWGKRSQAANVAFRSAKVTLLSRSERQLFVGELAFLPGPLLRFIAFDQPPVDEVGDQALDVELRVEEFRAL